MTIDSKQATEALNEIDAIVRAVRQSRIYNLASLIIIMWGVLVFAGYVVTFLSPRHAVFTWFTINVFGIAGSIAISALRRARCGVRTFDLRIFAAFLLSIAFGLFVCWFGHFTGRQLSTFWPIYFMLGYSIAGLWAGWAFVAIGLSISALTLVGYFFAGPWFDLWMAVVDGGGLVMGGLWMRRN